MGDANKAYGRVAGGALITVASTALGYSLSLLVRVMSAKLLPPAGFGLLVLGITVLSLGARIGALGLPRGLARNLPRTSDKQGMLSAGLAIASIAAITTGSLLALVSNNVALFLREPAFGPVMQVVSVGIVVSVLHKVIAGGLRGYEDAVGRNSLRIIKQVAILAGVVSGIVVWGTARGGTLGWVLGLVVTIVAGLTLLAVRRRLVGSLPAGSCAITDHSRELVVFSLPLMGTAAIWILLHQMDNLLLGFFTESAAVGFYDASYTLSRTVILFLVPAEFLFLPVISALHHDGELQAIRDVYYLTTKSVLLVTLPGYLLLVVFASELLSLFFTTAFQEARSALWILATGFFVNVVLGPSRQALIATGDTQTIFRRAAVGFVLNLVLNVILIPPFGIVGAATATAVSLTVINVLYLTYLYRDYGIRPLRWRIVGICFLSGGVLASGLGYLAGNGTVPVIKLIALGVVAYLTHAVIVIITGGIVEEDIAVLEQADDVLTVDAHRVAAVLSRFSVSRL
jgi:O-antigen/teichoic acid export membrane protein